MFYDCESTRFGFVRQRHHYFFDTFTDYASLFHMHFKSVRPFTSPRLSIHHLSLLSRSLTFIDLFIYNDSTLHQSTLSPSAPTLLCSCCSTAKHSIMIACVLLPATGSHLALGTFLGISLSVLYDTSPGS